MKTLLGRLVMGMIPGMIASFIAIVVAWNYLDDRDSRRHAGPCEAKPCFAEVNTRLVVLESELQARTEDRYRATDAARDHALMAKYADKRDRALRDEMAKLRLEVNARIDALNQ